MAKGYVEKMMGENERIIYVTRQHWMVFLRSILVELIIALVIVVLAALVTFGLPLLGFIIAPISFLIVLVLLIVPILGAVRDFTIWWNRMYIVTNHRVIQISGVFNKDVTDSSLEKVNDIKMDQSALGRILNYGDVEILTASELGVNLFKRIEDPVHFKTVLLNAKEQLEHGTGSGVPVRDTPNDVPGMIAELDQLRQKGILTEAEFQEKKRQLLSKM